MIPDITIQKVDKYYPDDPDSYSVFVGEHYVITREIRNPYALEYSINQAFAQFLRVWFDGGEDD